jgi:predicted lysophospholipase L1 biosynthesis ABC-type transport system permease subunit
MDRLTQDLRFALRRLLKKPLFTSVAIASLAVGIGANTVIFSLVNSIMLRDLPVDAPEEVVDITGASPASPTARSRIPTTSI